MTFRRDVVLIQQVLCDHSWFGGDLGSPRFCRYCGLTAGSRRDRRVDLLKALRPAAPQDEWRDDGTNEMRK